MTRGEIEVRRVVADDVQALAEVHLRAALHAYAGIFPPDAPKPTIDDHLDKWSRALADGDCVAFSGLLDGSVTGGVIASRRTEPGKGNLRHLYVDPGAWGCGLGRALHDEVLGWCAGEGIATPDLWVLEANSRSRAMYERWGWRLVDGDRFVNEGSKVQEVRYRLARVTGP